MRTARAFVSGSSVALWDSRPPLQVGTRLGDSRTREVCRGVWRCTVSADTVVSVTRRRKLNAPLCIIAIGLGMVVLSVLTHIDPLLMMGGGIWTAIGIDSYTRVKSTNFVTLRNCAVESEVMMSQDNQLVMEFVEEISSTVANLRALRNHEDSCAGHAADHAKAG